MLEYRKEVQITSTGMVVVSVIGSDGKNKGLNFFSPFFQTPKQVEKAAKKANAWADGIIEVCKRQECGNDPL